jgi:hypothetical protein
LFRTVGAAPRPVCVCSAAVTCAGSMSVRVRACSVCLGRIDYPYRVLPCASCVARRVARSTRGLRPSVAPVRLLTRARVAVGPLGARSSVVREPVVTRAARSRDRASPVAAARSGCQARASRYGGTVHRVGHRDESNHSSYTTLKLI